VTLAASNGAGPDLIERLSDRAVIVCAGSGGVGKTTVSAALALGMVERFDRRVMVLTVDPAKRLATALGMPEVGSEPVTVSPARLRQGGIRPKGELVAAMLDMKSTWDRMIERYAPSRESAERILANKFYKGISDAFIGSQEYMAMESLFELHAAGEYDTLVIDTPPSRNALDFLEAPNRISDFVGARLLSWLAGPSRFGFRVANLAATPFLHMADRLLGSDVLGELAAFVREVQGMYGGVQQRAREVYRLLRSDQTGFCVVTTLEPEPFAEAEFFVDRLRAYRMPLRAVVVNRVLPAALLEPDARTVAATLSDAERGALTWLSEIGGERFGADQAHRVAEAYTLLRRIAERNERQVARLSGFGRLPVARLPLADNEVIDIAGLSQLTRGLGGTPQ
jgi:anion-transporting  ArsA/GET3 family ATPase